jgi:uncharacterized membrane protein (Fun14 family)
MGGEILFIVLAILGFIAFSYLAYRCTVIDIRPYAISTLLFSSGAGLWIGYDSSLRNFLINFFVGFLIGFIIFWAHASLIKLLHKK